MSNLLEIKKDSTITEKFFLAEPTSANCLCRCVLLGKVCKWSKGLIQHYNNVKAGRESTT